jgi:hypothetical protein
MYVCVYPTFCLSLLTTHNNKSKEYQLQHNTRLMLTSWTFPQTLCVVEWYGVWGKWKNNSVMSESRTHTDKESSINVRKTTLQPLAANLRQQQKGMVSLLKNNYRRCNYGARSSYARLISQKPLKLSRWWICVKRKAHSASSAMGHVHRDLHFNEIIAKNVALKTITQ